MGEDEQKKSETEKVPEQKQGNLVVNEDKNVVIKKDEQPTFLSKEEAEKMITEAIAKIDQKISPIKLIAIS